jgi:nucleoside-diphosphate-sugar epimerase
MGDAIALERLVDSADVVVHCAGVTKARSPAEFRSVNAGGAARLARALAKKAPNARVVAVSSLAAREPHLSHYAASKAAGEEELRRSLPSAELVILRAAAVYGPWDRDTLEILRLVRAGVAPLLNDEAARVAMLHVEDAAAAIVAACDRGIPPAVYEVADEREGYSWGELMEAAETALRDRPARRFRVPRQGLFAVAGVAQLAGRLHSSALSIGKAREILHRDWRCFSSRRLPPEAWRPYLSLAAGFVDSVAWYRKKHWL